MNSLHESEILTLMSRTALLSYSSCVEMAAALVFTPINAIPASVAGARAAYESGKTRPVAYRKQQLKALMRMIDENVPQINAALFADLHR